MTQPSQANPHRIFLAPFQPPVRNPQETPGKPKETLTVAAETRRQPPSNCPRTPFAPLQGFLSPCIARFVFFCAQTQTPRRLHSIGRGNTFRASQLDALKTSCHLELKVRWLGISPHHSLQVDTCGIRTHAGRPHWLSVFCKICKSAALQSRQSCDCQSLLFVLPPHLTALPAPTNS